MLRRAPLQPGPDDLLSLRHPTNVLLPLFGWMLALPISALATVGRMEKLVFLVCPRSGKAAADLARPLLGDVVDALVASGARGLQVNVDDAEVAGAAVRFTHLDAPVGAVVSAWVDAAEATAPVLAAVLAGPDEVGSVAGYLVTESVPLADGRPVPAGDRTPGFANIALLRRPADLAPDEWRERWQGHHTRVAIETQSTFGYTQNLVVRAVTPDAPAIDAIVEELFPIEALADFHAFFDTGGDDEELGRRLTAMTTSTAAFGADRELDVIPTSRYLLSSPFPPAR